MFKGEDFLIMIIQPLIAVSTTNVSHLIGQITFFVLAAIALIWGIAKAVKR